MKDWQNEKNRLMWEAMDLREFKNIISTPPDTYPAHWGSTNYTIIRGSATVEYL